MTNDEIKALWREHGGGFHGPHVEQAFIPEAKFYGFVRALVQKAEAERDELQQVFDLQWEADQRAIKRWQAAHPGHDMVWPDRADMVLWLMEQHSTDQKR